MKRGTPSHRKTKRLCRILRKPNYAGVGLLESMWHLVARYTPDGAIGRLADCDIAREIDWRGDPSILIDALVESEWLHRCPCHRLYVHDWKDHADQTVGRVLKNRGLDFVRHYASIVLECDTPNASISYPETSQPLPLPLPEPLPEPLPLPEPKPERKSTQPIEFPSFDFPSWFTGLLKLWPIPRFPQQAQQALATMPQIEDPKLRIRVEENIKAWAVYYRQDFIPKKPCLYEHIQEFGAFGTWDERPTKASTTGNRTAEKVLEVMQNNASR